MSVKYFCDECGDEIGTQKTNQLGRVKRQYGHITVEVLRAVDNQWNGGQVCNPCVIKAVMNGADVS